MEEQGLITLAYLDTSDHVASNQLLKHLLRLVGRVSQQVQQQLNVKDMQRQLCMLCLQVQTRGQTHLPKPVRITKEAEQQCCRYKHCRCLL